MSIIRHTRRGGKTAWLRREAERRKALGELQAFTKDVAMDEMEKWKKEFPVRGSRTVNDGGSSD